MVKKTCIGILAYGSLIDEPGDELLPLIIDRVPCITPFNIEYARMSKSRDFAPTLIPISEGGAAVNAVILVLDNNVLMDEAKNMLWRRETRTKDTNKKFKKQTNPSSNSVQIRSLDCFEGFDQVIFTFIESNLGINSPIVLANLSIQSCLNEAGAKKIDGIRYLLNAKKNGLITPLTNEYERCILEFTATESLEAAIEKLDEERPLFQREKIERNKFEGTVSEIADLILNHGVKTTFQGQEVSPEEFIDKVRQNSKEFLKNCHNGFKMGQQRILSLMLEFETEKESLKSSLKKLDKHKFKRHALQLKNSIKSIENKEHVLRHLIDTIAWQMINGQLYIARRLYQHVKGEKRLLKSNITSVVKVANEINEGEFDFALITDLSAYIQTGDLIIKKSDGTLAFMEVKEGKKNQEIIKIVDSLTKGEESIEETFNHIPKDCKFIQQLDRNLKQMGEMVNLINILNNDEGTDKSGKTIKIITPKEDTKRFDDKLYGLWKQLEERGFWAYDVIDECLHIGMYKGHMKIDWSSYFRVDR